MESLLKSQKNKYEKIKICELFMIYEANVYASFFILFINKAN